MASFKNRLAPAAASLITANLFTQLRVGQAASASTHHAAPPNQCDSATQPMSHPIAILLVACLTTSSLASTWADDRLPPEFYQRDSIRIVVTDSGLGGVSVAADVHQKLIESRQYRDAEVIFFNAQPHAAAGYNAMASTAIKAAVFDRALTYMESLQPDVILIACNTLSVVYDETEHSRFGLTPAIGIIDCGVDLIMSSLQRHPDADVLLFATPTTVERSKHRDELLRRGFPADRLWQQPCSRLAGEIERAPDSAQTKTLIEQYAGEVAMRLGHPTQPVLVSYNCTHYGYVDEAFRQAMMKLKIPVAQTLDPNPLLSDVLFVPGHHHRFDEVDVRVSVLTQPQLSQSKREAIAGLIAKTSPQTASAVEQAIWVPDAFEWRDIVEITPLMVR